MPPKRARLDISDLTDNSKWDSGNADDTPLIFNLKYYCSLFICLGIPLICAGVLISYVMDPVYYCATEPVLPPIGSKPRNLIFVVADGYGPASNTLTRIASNRKLLMDSLIQGSVRTYSATSYVTDSAAGATAFACGKKTYNAGIAVDSAGQPIGTLLEAAIAKGYKTGVVAKSRLSHATPAAFTAHSIDRNYEDFIADQQIRKKIDILFGGGRDIFSANRSIDGSNKTVSSLISFAKIFKQYSYISNTTEMLNLTKNNLPVLGLFAPSHMNYAIDKPNNNSEPSLPLMVRTALNLLGNATLKSHYGFVLIVEPSLIDIAAHAHDGAAHVREILEFDETLQEIKSWIDLHGSTMMLASADHETAGLTLGKYNGGNYEMRPGQVMLPTMSGKNLAVLMLNKSSTYGSSWSVYNSTAMFQQYMNLSYTLTTAQMNLLQTAVTAGDLEALTLTIGELVSSIAYINWAHIGHTGVDVPLYAYGSSITSYHGNYDNTDLNQIANDFLGTNITDVTVQLRASNYTVKPVNTTTPSSDPTNNQKRRLPFWIW